MKRYWKAIMSVIGGVALGAMGVAAAKGYGTCTVDPVTQAIEACTVFGFTNTQVVAFLTMIGSTLGVGFGPKNAE